MRRAARSTWEPWRAWTSASFGRSMLRPDEVRKELPELLLAARTELRLEAAALPPDVGRQRLDLLEAEVGDVQDHAPVILRVDRSPKEGGVRHPVEERAGRRQLQPRVLRASRTTTSAVS